tara:strand:+ start:2481 stop:2645 length:165 start_codon:yes stop_codon:yes gene_type:complete
MAVVKASEQYSHQKRYNAKMEHEGLRRVTVWVPDTEAETLTDFAAQLRKKAKAV